MNNTGKGLLAYLLGPIGSLIVLFGFKDNDRKITFHAYQSITLSIATIVASIALTIISAIPFIGFVSAFVLALLPVFTLVLEILGIVKVCNDDVNPKVFLVGDLTEKLFGNQINAVPETVVANAPSFDPNTGQPINQQPAQGNFDPVTGQPVNQQPAQGNFDPNTGQPVNQQPEASVVAPVEETAAPVDVPAEEAAAPVDVPAEEAAAPVDVPVEEAAAPVDVPAEEKNTNNEVI